MSDRLGGDRPLTVAALAGAAGLMVVGLVSDSLIAVAGLIVLSLGQGLAVPALGLIALRRIPVEYQGAAAGTFFAYFDAAVGLGGPAVGAVAGAFGPQIALALAGAAVAGAIPAAIPSNRR